MSPFTVILIYPDWMADQYGEKLYKAHINAPTAAQAVRMAQMEVARLHLTPDDDVDHFADSFAVVDVLEGFCQSAELNQTAPPVAYRCPKCGSEHVQELRSIWVNLNTGEQDDSLCDGVGERYWCEDCETHPSSIRVIDRRTAT